MPFSSTQDETSREPATMYRVALSATLREALERYSREALGIVAARLGTSLPADDRDGWLLGFHRLQGEFETLDSYLAVTRALRADPDVARHMDTVVGTAQGRIRVDIPTLLRSVLFHLLEGRETILFDEARFYRLFSEIERYFGTTSESLLFVAPLLNFKMAGDRVELGSRFALVKLPEEEIQSIKRDVDRFVPFAGGGALTGFEECALELYRDEPRVIGHTDPPSLVFSHPSDDEFGEVLSALRLFKQGSVGYTFVRISRLGWSPTAMTRWHWSHEGEVRHGPDYALSAEEVSDFSAFWEDFRTARKRRRPRVNLALRRFNFAYGRFRPEDRIIDHAIALEALLLKRGETQELKYRLALRGAFLLGSTTEERVTLHSLLTRAYDERSNIVHGSEVPKQVMLDSESVPFHGFVERVEAAVRAAIREFLRREEDEARVLDLLDARVVRGA